MRPHALTNTEDDDDEDEDENFDKVEKTQKHDDFDWLSRLMRHTINDSLTLLL